MTTCSHNWANPSVPCPNCEKLTINQAAIIRAMIEIMGEEDVREGILSDEKYKKWLSESFGLGSSPLSAKGGEIRKKIAKMFDEILP